MDLSYVDKNKFQKLLGVYVSEQRVVRGLTLAELSRRTGISVARLKKIEGGQAQLSAQTCEVLQCALELDEKKMERLLEIARIGFVQQFMELGWTGEDE